MTSIWRKLAGLIPGLTAMASPSATAADSDAAMKNGRDALLARLQAAGVGQVSTRQRASVAL